VGGVKLCAHLWFKNFSHHREHGEK